MLYIYLQFNELGYFQLENTTIAIQREKITKELKEFNNLTQEILEFVNDAQIYFGNIIFYKFVYISEQLELCRINEVIEARYSAQYCPKISNY